MSIATALVGEIRRKKAARADEDRAAVERALMYAAERGESKYWQRKQCRAKGKVFDRKTGECRTSKITKRGCGKDEWYNKKTGKCQKKGTADYNALNV